MTTKICNRCDTEKDLDEFYDHPKMKDGKLNQCKTCKRKDWHRYRAENIEVIRERDRARSSKPHRIAHNLENARRWRKKNPEKYKAHIILGNAVRGGKILKPTECQECGFSGVIHGHHEDYSKPLDVDWLCAVCHSKLKKTGGSGEPQ